MAAIVADATPVNVEGLTRPEFIRRLGIETGLVFTGTASETSDDESYLIDELQLKTLQSSPQEWRGGWLRMASGNNAGEIKPIVDFIPELGKIPVEPFFSNPILIGEEYELWKVNPTIVLSVIDQCLKSEIYSPCWTVLSDIIDYDMEQPGTTHWTAGGTAVVTKTSSYPRVFSNQQLRVVSVAAGDYARSDVYRVEPNRQYHLSGIAQVLGEGTARLQAYDETNGAEIMHYDSNRRSPTRITFQNFTTPMDCHSVSYRLVNVEAGLTVEWDEICTFQTSAADVALPWWVTLDDQVKGIFELHPMTYSNNLWDPQLRGEADRRFDVIKQFGGGANFRAQARMGYLSWPLYMLGIRPTLAYEDDEESKYIDINLLLACVKYKLYKYHSQPIVTGLLDSDNFKMALGDAETEWMRLSQAQATNLNEVIDSPTPWAKFINPRFTYGEV